LNELDIQRQLLDACIDAGGDGFKTSNRFLKGVLDLYLMLPPFPHLWLELKYEKHMNRSGEMRINMTPHQHNFARRVNSKGGIATCALVVNCGNGQYQIGVVPHNIINTTKFYKFPGITKMRGDKWPIQRIMEKAVSCL
jgi:hypothetical protein